jgi:hypothetical protein
MESSTDTHDLDHYSSSPSTHKTHSQQLSPSNEIRVFDLDNLAHDERLKQWCKIHWSATIKKSLDNYNPAIYHDCCFCFSRRGCSKRWDHPVEDSQSISKIPTLKQVTSEEELHSWLRNKMQDRQKTGETLVFPTINSPHLQAPRAREDFLSPPKATEFLRKRCIELSQEKSEVLSLVDKLKADNARLHSSSKSWFDKYQEAIRSREESLASTPVKRRVNMANDELLFLD